MMKLFKSVFTMLAAITFAGSLSVAQAQEGETYRVINPPQATANDNGKIEVIEAFSYGCSHCHRFEPVLKRWLKSNGDNIEFTRLPAIFNAQMALFARVYYSLEALDAIDKAHMPIFDAIHLQKRDLSTDEQFAALVEEHGVDRKKFLKAMRSPYVETKVNRASELGKRYRVEATPSLIVNGKYITNPGMGRIGFNGMLQVVETLVKQEAAM